MSASGRPAAEMAPVGIAFITGQLGLGGAEQQLYYLLEGLDAGRFRPVVMNAGSPDDYWAAPIRALNIPVFDLRPADSRLQRVVQIARLLRRHKVGLVHSWTFHTNLYSAVAGRLAGVPVRLGSMREHWSGLPPSRWLRSLGWRGLDAVVTNSNSAARDAAALGNVSATFRIIPNGVRPPAITDEGQRLRLKSELGFSACDRIIGTIGRMDENKNQRLLLEGFALIADRWPEARLALIGDGPLRPALQVRARDLGIADRVKWTGALPAASRYLPAMEICCLTSRTEGLPNLIMEGSAAGLPVVSTDCGGSAELIEDGCTGMIVRQDSAATLGDALHRLLSSPDMQYRLGACGRSKMVRELGVEAMVSRMSSAYCEILRAKGLMYE